MSYGTAYLFRSDGVLGDAPSVTEAIRQLKDGKHKLALCCAALLEAGLQR